MRLWHLLVVLLVIFTNSCTYTGHIKGDYFNGACQPIDKIPMKVGILLDGSLAGGGLHAKSTSRNVNIYFGEYVRSSINTSLKCNFLESREVVDPRLFPEADVIATYAYAIANGHISQSLSLVDPKSRSVVGKYESKSPILYQQPEGVFVADYIGLMTLGLLTPMSSPLGTQFVGSAYEADTKRAIDGNILNIHSDIRKDLQLYNYSTINNTPKPNKSKDDVSF